MKILKIVLFVTWAVLLFSSCSKSPKEKTRKEQIEEFRSSLTQSDTTTMLQLCDRAMQQLKDKQFDLFFESLSEYDDSMNQVMPLTEKMKNRLERKFRTFPVLEYERRYYSFQLEGCNDVRYDVVFATAEDAGTEEAPITSYMFNPVKVNGEWKLCVKVLTDDIDRSLRITY